VSILIAAHDRSAPELAAEVAPHVPGGWDWAAWTTAWGAVVVAGDGWAEIDGWLILGCPQQHPWGVPGAQLPFALIAAELSRYGPAALQSTAGPVVALDLLDGGGITALNGIIPLFASQSGSWVTGTSFEAVGAVTRSAVQRIPPGALASPDGTVALMGDAFVPESVPGATWRNFQQELDALMQRLGPRRIAKLGSVSTSSCDWARTTWDLGGHEEFVFMPKAMDRRAGATPLTRYCHLWNSVLPELWWASRLVGRWLCAPGFERPAIDTVSMIGDKP
jgi:hypothetical protein